MLLKRIFMKKVLHLSLALALLSSTALADHSTGAPKPTLQLSGKLQAFALASSSKSRSVNAPATNFGTKGNLRFDINAQTASGTEYGGVAEVELNRAKVGSQDFFRAVYAFVSSAQYGTWQLGDLDGALVQGIVDGRQLMGGTGGFDGDMWAVVTPTSGVLVDMVGSSKTKYATKIVYKSPTVKGMQFVFSYTPQSKMYGLVDRSMGEDFDQNFIAGKKPTISKVVEGVLSYGFSLGELGVTLYAGGSVATPRAGVSAVSGIKAAKTFQLSMLLAWRDFQFAAGFLNNQSSLHRTNEVGDSGIAYNSALSYNTGPHTVALGYFGSKRKVTGGSAKANVGSATYEYSIAPGWTVFTEANYFKTTSTVAYLTDVGAQPDAKTAAGVGYLYATNNTKNAGGGVFLLGTTLRF